jgi:hypothetical protein
VGVTGGMLCHGRGGMKCHEGVICTGYGVLVLACNMCICVMYHHGCVCHSGSCACFECAWWLLSYWCRIGVV